MRAGICGKQGKAYTLMQICADSKQCCSFNGFCGSSPLYCRAAVCVGGPCLATSPTIQPSPTRTPVLIPNVPTPPTVVKAKLGEACGGNSASAKQCDVGLTCDLSGLCRSSTPPVTTPPPPPPVTTPASQATKPYNVLFSDSGYGSYYYDFTGAHCPLEAPYPENNGITTCESYTPGPNQIPLGQHKTNNIVALRSDFVSDNREKWCGKRARVSYKGKPVDAVFYVWDACLILLIAGGACATRGVGVGPRLDFSLSAIKAINPNACTDGITDGISWEITDEQVVPFVP